MNSRNDSNSNSRRTASSPYLASSLNNRSTSQYRPKQGKPTNSGSRNFSSRSRFERQPSVVPPRGSRSAPPIYSSVHEYYQRRAELQKEVHKTILKSKLDRIAAYHEQLSKEITDLERGCGDAGIRVPKQNVRNNPPPSTSSKTKLKQFRVLGGTGSNLAYKIHRKPDKEGKVRSFSLEVDVRGFMTENVEVTTEDQEMVVTACKMNGMKKDLKVIAPSVRDMEKVYIHPPRFGVLVIDF